MIKTIIIGIVVTVIGLFALTAVNKYAQQGNASDLNGFPTSEVYNDNEVKVSITGEVNHIGDYYIAQDDTLGDLVNMAGGVTDRADPSAYNLSITIGIRTSFYIAPLATNTGVCVEEYGSKTNINDALEAELKETGFNSSQSASIVEYRTTKGLFEAIEDIMNVKGVGAATFAKVKNKICIA